MALNWTQILMAAAGTIGFSLIFRLRARYVLRDSGAGDEGAIHVVLHHLDGAAHPGQHALLLHGCHRGGGKGSSAAVWHDHIPDCLRDRNGDEHCVGDLQSSPPHRGAERE